MPEYLAPGVYVEEVSFRSKSIEAVSTSTTGFAGLTRSGPVYYDGGPRACEPRLITSFTEFERVYGGLEPLRLGADNAPDRLPYLAHAARAFFENGGQRLYVSRVFVSRDGGADLGLGELQVPVGAELGHWRARWPGKAGNVNVNVVAVRSGNVLVDDGTGNLSLSRISNGSLVELKPAADPAPAHNAPLDGMSLLVVSIDEDGIVTLNAQGGGAHVLTDANAYRIVSLRVTVTGDRQTDETTDVQTSPLQRRYIGRVLELDDPENENSRVWFDYTPAGTAFEPAELAIALQGVSGRLTGGNDGAEPTPDDLAGQEADPDDATVKATGLTALGEVDDVAIVAMPDAAALGDDLSRQVATQKLITHAEQLKYRIAVLDGPEGSSLNEIRAFRGKFDSSHAAIYHPWIEILDPLERPAQGAPPRRILLPPSGFVCGIYARNDVNRGVFKAPANEIVRGLTQFEANINTGRQQVLNPEGINALRFFEGRGHRVWGARTVSSDPEWKYVNVRRLFNMIEHSIDKGSQWAVFEPNNRRLWDNVRRTIEDFLLVLWKDGALMGNKPSEAFFVRCDRTTMTQNDLDNGRLICLVGIAPVKPAEFVIFRIGQWTADAN